MKKDKLLDTQDQELENALKKQFTLHETGDIVSLIQQFHNYSKELARDDNNSENDFNDFLKFHLRVLYPSLNNKELTKEDALETIINTHEKKIESLEQVLQWFNWFVDAIQAWDNKLYNNACKYADKKEGGCI
tara:strand:- start:770 stop:1168 length:399 start_codon:yes stop_codon:yes gene_type:complete